MATTFDYYVRKDRRSDGTRAVKIRMTHNRKNIYFPTSIYVTDRMMASDGATIRDTRVITAVENRLRAYREAFLLIEYPELKTANRLADLVEKNMRRNAPFELDLFGYSEQLMATMEKKTAEGYRTALNAVRRFIGGDRLDINDITTQWVQRFRTFLETEPAVSNGSGKYAKKSRGSRAIGYYLGCIRHIHNEARLEFNDYDTDTVNIPRQPFVKGSVPAMPITDHRDLCAAQLHQLLAYQPRKGSREEMAKDVFFLSFALAGTNTIDLYSLKKSDVSRGLVTYRRAKTDSTRRDHAEITLKIIPMAATIIEKRKSKTGAELLEFAGRYSNSHEFNRAVNKGLKDLAKHVGMDVRLTTYHARHSWATIARNVVKVDYDVVNSALNHARIGGDRTTDIYIAKDYTSIWVAQEKVARLVETVERGIIPIKSAI